jgi:hypothetical protein
MAIPVARIAAVTFVGGLLAVTALAGQPAAGPDAGVVAPQLAKMDGERKNRGEGRREGGRRRSGGDGAALACEACAGIEGYVPPSEIADEVRLMVGKTRGGDKNYAVQVQKERGGIETGLKAAFIDGGQCPEIDSEQWAIDYSHKRPIPAIHKGVDIPQPTGTPIRAIAAGTVVGKFLNDDNRKGTEVMLRHTPKETGLEFWTYSQYTHMLEMSPLEIGAKVAIGQEIGKTSNTGVMGRRERRPALHFAIVYSRHPEWSNDGIFVIPRDGFWMDPNAFYRLEPPYESKALAALPEDAKKVAVPYMKPDGSFVPAGTKRIWPYPCP